ncbi:LexA family transcriptional regulator [Brevibacillus antibioticus]|uniref:LexA family transcriptional regulator n=1 Tax=Brevibacillus antibioticus TaxID=2570228 RepID=A0A4U2YCP4_9BACL|nr:S24 family peptidase [Brevibacillus antibioticus]TKI57191.1 LexA family transcriptional regulator [Brevibacillus antibioticus]
MSYSETLALMVKKSGLTLKEIVEKCEEHGVKITPAYISRLQTGKQAPASEEVNTALAKVCGGDVERLLYEGYLEKAPEFIKELIGTSIKYLKDVALSIARNQYTDFRLQMHEQMLNGLSDIEFLKSHSNLFENWSDISSSHIMLDPSNKDERFFTNPYSGIKMQDNSMEPTIPEGANIHISENDKINSGDIVLIVFKDNSSLVRRYFLIRDEDGHEVTSIVFTCDNPAFSPIIEHNPAQIKMFKATSIDFP